MTQSMPRARVLVTGAQGHGARHTIAAWLRDDPDVTVLGVGRASRRDAVFPHTLRRAGRMVPAPVPHALREALRSPRYEYQRVELSDRAAFARILQGFRPSVVVHLAGALPDDRSGDTAALLDAIGASGIDPPRVVLATSVVAREATAQDQERAALTLAAQHRIPLVRAR